MFSALLNERRALMSASFALALTAMFFSATISRAEAAPSAPPSMPAPLPTSSADAVRQSPGGAGAPETPAPVSEGGATTAYKVTINNTLKFSSGLRLLKQDPNLANFSPQNGRISQINLNDGDNNFNQGSLISARADLLSELDVASKTNGFRLSGAAWYDPVYSTSNSNLSPFTTNQSSVPRNNFTKATRKVVGLHAELLDAFAYVNTKLAGAKTNIKAGQLAKLWGETVFFGANGVAGTMAPIDLVKLLSVPNSEFKEIIRPVPQVAIDFAVTPNFSIGTYYQLQWAKNRFVPVGDYFSAIDLYDDGGERLFFPPLANFPPPTVPQGVPTALFRGSDVYAKNSGQFGVQFRYRPKGTNLDLGLYGTQFNEKSGQLLIDFNQNPDFSTGKLGEYRFVYPNGIQSLGASVSTSVGTLNIATEISIRSHADLTSGGGFNVVVPSLQAPPFAVPVYNNTDKPFWAIGNTAHVNVSVLESFEPNAVAKESLLVLELAGNTTTKVTANRSALDPNTTTTAAAFRAVYTPTYRNVRPGLDIDVPLGFGRGIFGNSSAVPNFPAGGVGDVEVGLVGTYRSAIKGTLQYTHYTGPPGGYLDQRSLPSGQQALHDRDFISFSLSRSF